MHLTSKWTYNGVWVFKPRSILGLLQTQMPIWICWQRTFIGQGSQPETGWAQIFLQSFHFFLSVIFSYCCIQFSFSIKQNAKLICCMITLVWFWFFLPFFLLLSTADRRPRCLVTLCRGEGHHSVERRGELDRNCGNTFFMFLLSPKILKKQKHTIKHQFLYLFLK